MGRKSTGFMLFEGKRRSGKKFWLVRGTLHTEQDRREFSDRTEALVFQEQKNAELFGRSVDRAPILTSLPPEKVRVAEAVYMQLERRFPGVDLIAVGDFYARYSSVLKDSDMQSIEFLVARINEKHPGWNLKGVCEWFMRSYRPPRVPIKFIIAMRMYLNEVNNLRLNEELSAWQARSISQALRRFAKWLIKRKQWRIELTEISKELLLDFLNETRGGKRKAKTWDNRRGYYTTFFKFCIGQSLAEENPATQLPTYGKRGKNKRKNKRPTILRAKRAAALMALAEEKYPRLVPYLVLTLFLGIRPTMQDGEIGRFTRTDLNLRKRNVRMEPDDTKTGFPRDVKLHPNVMAWLRAYPIEKFPVKARNFKKLYLKLKKEFPWGYDALRHTFCSMLVGETGSVAHAALQAGNSEKVLWANYLNLVEPSEAKKFWQIRPLFDRSKGEVAGKVA